MTDLEQILYSTIGTTALIAAAAWLARNLILERLRNSVRHEFERKLEALKSELRAGEAEIEAIRNIAATAAAGRGKAADARKLEAIDQLWEGFLRARQGTWPLLGLSITRLENVEADIESDEKLRQYFELAYPNIDGLMQDIDSLETEKSRPWVSALAWAYYSAYVAMVGYCIAWIQMAKLGNTSIS